MRRKTKKTEEKEKTRKTEEKEKAKKTEEKHNTKKTEEKVNTKVRVVGKYKKLLSYNGSTVELRCLEL